MGAVSNVLIVGAGPAGLSSAIALRRAGIDVELVERFPSRDVPGSELMVGGSFLRALRFSHQDSPSEYASGKHRCRSSPCASDGRVPPVRSLRRGAETDVPDDPLQP